ncbi:MAG: regulatory protein RecX [Gammaproteobacteria bacterium]|nr:regulatory protein RecX [Gammaproteobacteria bacterium]
MISESSESLLNEVASEKVLPRSSSAYKKLCLYLRKKAMDLLARREHAIEEMRQKLRAALKKKVFFAKKAASQKMEGFEDSCFSENDHNDDDVVMALEKVIDDLQGEGLLSDERFTEAFVRYRQNNGHGPMRIQTELRERGVSEKIQAAWLDFADPQWIEQVAQVRSKRFGDNLPGDYKERARQARFLQYRGFTTDQIKQTLAGDSYD